MSDDEREDALYNNAHRTLLQAFMARSVMTEEELETLWADILKAHGTSHRPFPVIVIPVPGS
jgi:hypothetical protein